jgi:expansin (peptidoglycan-binding protein)
VIFDAHLDIAWNACQCNRKGQRCQESLLTLPDTFYPPSGSEAVERAIRRFAEIGFMKKNTMIVLWFVIGLVVVLFWLFRVKTPVQ